jgi:hypothetical protein
MVAKIFPLYGDPGRLSYLRENISKLVLTPEDFRTLARFMIQRHYQNLAAQNLDAALRALHSFYEDPDYGLRLFVFNHYEFKNGWGARLPGGVPSQKWSPVHYADSIKAPSSNPRDILTRKRAKD